MQQAATDLLAPGRGGRTRLVLVPLLVSLLFLGAVVHAEEPTAAPRVPDMPDLIRRYAADEASIESFYPEPLDPTRTERVERFLATWRARLAAVPFEALDVDGQVDHLLLGNHLQRRADQLALGEARRQEMTVLLPFGDDVVALEAARRALEALDPAQAAEQVSALTTAVSAAQQACKEMAEAKRPSPVVAYRASKSLRRLRGLLQRWFDYRNGYEPAFGWWVRTPFAALQKALEDYERTLREEIAGVRSAHTAPLLGDPIGREALLRALAREVIPYTPEQLLTIAWEEFAWCEEQGRKAAAELAIDGDWRSVVEHVKGLHAEPGAQDDLVASQAREAIAFVTERDLLTVPPLCEETWRLEMISQQGQKTLPFAVYNNQSMLVAYAMEGMDHNAKKMAMRGNNEHFTRIVTPHELIPGHHLQLFVAARNRAYRSLFRTAFLVEGWALHWEMLLWDLGWARNAADRVGMLFWRMHRCARIIVTLAFHLGQMEPEEMITFLVERVGLERDGATSEVRRYIAGDYGPLYQCAYMVGGLQMRALYRELVDGGSWTPKAFHDAVLAQNSIPIEYIRLALRARPVARGQAAAWAFRGEVTPHAPK